MNRHLICVQGNGESLQQRLFTAWKNGDTELYQHLAARCFTKPQLSVTNGGALSGNGESRAPFRRLG
jgi:hypothetical protein